MRILALRTNGLVLPHIHASMVKAIRSLNVEVCEIPVPRTLNEIRLFLKTLSNGFDAGFIVDLGDNPTFIQNFREFQLTLKYPWIIWFVDEPEGYGFPESCEPAWSHVFCWDEEISRRLSLDQSWKGRPVIHLPLAGSSEIFFPENPKPDLAFPGGVFVGSTRHENSFLEDAAATIPDFKEHETELWNIYSKDFNRPLQDLVWEYLSIIAGRSFGQIRKEPLAKLWVYACVFKIGIRKRKEVAAQILESGAVFGDEGWRETMRRRYRGGANYGKELCAIYNRSSLVLDIRQPQCRTGLSQRIFDASACGVPVLTEWSRELEFLFDPENEISSYRTIEEGIRKRTELLRSPRMARKMAEKAKERVLTEHTYRNRALQILRVFKPGLP